LSNYLPKPAKNTNHTDRSNNNIRDY